MAASTVGGFELASYQRAMRTLLAHPLITERYPDAGALPLIRRWVDPLRQDLNALFGYTLELSRTTARLIRVTDDLDATMPARTGTSSPPSRSSCAEKCFSCVTHSNGSSPERPRPPWTSPASTNPGSS